MYSWIPFNESQAFAATHPEHRVVLAYYFRPELEGPWTLFFQPRSAH